MTKPWQDIDENIILNYHEAETALIAQYERIMSKKLRESLLDLKSQVTVAGQKVAVAVNTLNDTLKETNNFIHDETEKIVQTYEKVANTEKKTQMATLFLSIIIALSTVAYVIITWQSVQAMHMANEMQNESLNIEYEKAHKPTRYFQ